MCLNAFWYGFPGNTWNHISVSLGFLFRDLLLQNLPSFILVCTVGLFFLWLLSLSLLSWSFWFLGLLSSFFLICFVLLMCTLFRRGAWEVKCLRPCLPEGVYLSYPYALQMISILRWKSILFHTFDGIFTLFSGLKGFWWKSNAILIPFFLCCFEVLFSSILKFYKLLCGFFLLSVHHSACLCGPFHCRDS